MDDASFATKRRLPKLMACMTKQSLENLRNKLLFGVDFLDAKGIRRRRLPLHDCLILELKEAGYTESSNYLQDLLYDNAQLVAEDDIGIVVDLRQQPDYLEHICNLLMIAEKERDKENTKKECLTFLKLAMHYAEKGKGILWLAEKFYLVAIAASSRYMMDGGRLKGCCKYHYASFLLDKFPGADPEESYLILTEVRDYAIGKDWPLYEAEKDTDIVPPDTVFEASAIQLHRVLLSKSRALRKTDTAKSERLARLAERRARDAHEPAKTAEAIIEVGICQLMMNNLNNAQKTFERANRLLDGTDSIVGLCEIKMHMAAVMQRLGEHETAARLLTEMGALAMEHKLSRQLGRALHLLGELHLRRERPELGTQHLAEAFACFMGFASVWEANAQSLSMFILNEDDDTGTSKLDVIFKKRESEIYEEEAEQSRLMMAISAGQELMPSYFNLLREAGTCAVAKLKAIEWKLSKAGWWVKRRHHDFMPCMCSVHNRTPLDVLRAQLEIRESQILHPDQSEGLPYLARMADGKSLQKFRSSFMQVHEH